MGAGAMSLPPLPPGFVLESQASSIPPLPPGFELEDDVRTWDQPGEIVSGSDRARYRAAGIDPDVDPNAGISRGRQFLEGVGASIDATVQGAKQTGTSMAGYFASQNPSLVSSESRAGLQRTMADQQASEVERRRVNSQMSGWGKGGQIAGTIGQIVGPGVILRGAQAASAFLPATIRGNAAQGAVVGAVQPTVSEGERVGGAAMGAVGGAVGAALPGAATAAYRGVSGLAPPIRQAAQTRQAAQVLNQFAADPAALRAGAMNPQVIVPGSLPTLAEASGDVGLAGLQRTLANTPDFGNQLTQRQQANNLARVRAIESGFGGADDVAADAIRTSTRTAELPGLREAKKQVGAEAGRIISWIDRVGNSTRFRGNPDVEQALGTVRNMISVPIDDAGRLSAARGIVSESLNKPRRMSSADFDAVREARRLVISGQQQGREAAEVLRDLRKIKPTSVAAASTINDMSRALKVAERGRPDVASLYETRKYITNTLMSRADGATMEALRGAVKQLDDRIGEVAPSYKQYLTNYASGMREADRVAVGADLLGTGRAVRTATNEPSLTPDAFGRAAGDMDRTVRRATGFNRATATRTLTPEQLKVVDSVRRDLERYSRASTDGKAIGSNTVQNAIGGNSFQSAVGPVGAAMVEPVSGVMMMAVNQMRSKYGERVAALVQEAMLDPARAAEILASVPSGQRSAVVRALAPLLTRSSSVTGVVLPTLAE